jgi:hypothetical protein
MDPIRRVEPIPGDTKVNPDHISKRDVPAQDEFKTKLDEEIKKRLKQIKANS